MPGRYLVAGRGDARRVVQPLKFTDLAVLHQRDDHAGGSGPGRAAGAVQVILVVVRRVELNDQVDVVHMDAAGRDVGGDQDTRVPGGERVQGPLPLVLVAVAVDGRGVDAGPDSCLASRSAPCLVRTKNRVRPGRPAISAATGTLSCGGQDQHAGARRAAGSVEDVDRVQRGIADVGGHQLADAAVQGGGEEHPLAAGGRLRRGCG